MSVKREPQETLLSELSRLRQVHAKVMDILVLVGRTKLVKFGAEHEVRVSSSRAELT